ncbi:MAG: ArsR/SmtB family transcription factor [Nitrospirota bacterium]
MTTKTDKIAKIFKVLGDPNRLNIVLSIGRESRSVTEIIDATELSQTLVSFHLKALRDAAIVRTERNGPFIYYSLTESSLMDILDDLARTAASIELIGTKISMTANGRGSDKRRR